MRLTAALPLALLLLGSPAIAQPRRRPPVAPQRALTAAEAVARARQQLLAAHPADALATLQSLAPRLRTTPAVVATRAMATFDTLGVRLEPGAARALAPSARRDLDAVVRTLTTWTTTTPDDGAAALTLGRARMVQGELDLAADRLETASRLLANDPVVWNDRAMVLVALHRLPEAERCLGEATRLAPQDAEPWSNLGAVRLARGAADRAAEAFRRAIEAAPSEPRHHSDLGSALLAGGDAEGAISAYRRAAEFAPDNGVVLANLGYALAHANHLDEALTTLQRAVTVAPRSVTAWNNLAAVRVRRNERAEAIDALHRAQAIDPTDPRARAALESLEQTPTTAITRQATTR